MKSVSVNPWPYGHASAVVIRDDDICYFTDPYRIEQIYRQAWKEQFKVSLGVIPKVKTIDRPFIPPSHRRNSSFHKFYDNKELLGYLKERLVTQQIDIAQHGLTHEMLKGKPEFCINSSQEIETRLRCGGKILEEHLPMKVSVFIAPWNTVSNEAWVTLKKEGLALCRKEAWVYSRVWSFFHTFPLIRILANRIFTRCLHLPNKGVIKFRGMIELHHSFDWYEYHRSFVSDKKNRLNTLNIGIKSAKQEFMKAVAVGDMFCILNHYWCYYGDWQDDVFSEMLNSFYLVLDFLNNFDIWKTTLTEIVNWLRKLDKLEVKVSAKKVILKSPNTMRGVTINGEGCTLVPANDSDTITTKEKDTSIVTYKLLKAGETKVCFIDKI